MTLQFPNNPSTGQQFTASNGLIYRWDGEKWITLGSAAVGDIYVQKIGDTMTGDLNLPNLVATGDVQSTSQNGGQLAGFRNVIINGNLAINQRGVDIASVATGAYGQDRWKKTAGGMTQIIEAGNFEPGATYTLSGTGVTTQQLTAPASGNWTLPDIPVTARKIQLELGPVATPYEQRPISVELSMCQRYFYKYTMPANRTLFSGYSKTNSNSINAGDLSEWVHNLSFPVEMRTSPTGSNFTNLGGNNYVAIPGYRAITNAVASSAIGSSPRPTATSMQFTANVGGIGITQGASYPMEASFSYDFDAEL